MGHQVPNYRTTYSDIEARAAGRLINQPVIAMVFNCPFAQEQEPEGAQLRAFSVSTIGAGYQLSWPFITIGFKCSAISEGREIQTQMAFSVFS